MNTVSDIHPGMRDAMHDYLSALEQCLPSEEIRHLYALSFAERLYGGGDASTQGPLPQLCAALLLAQVLKERREGGRNGL